MKRLTGIQIDLKALEIKRCWICMFGILNADKLSLAVRRLFKKERKENAKLFVKTKKNSIRPGGRDMGGPVRAD